MERIPAKELREAADMLLVVVATCFIVSLAVNEWYPTPPWWLDRVSVVSGLAAVLTACVCAVLKVFEASAAQTHDDARGEERGDGG